MSHISKKKDVRIRDFDILCRALTALGYQIEAVPLEQVNPLRVNGVGSVANAQVRSAFLVAGEILTISFMVVNITQKC